jgi:hypothetical protein
MPVWTRRAALKSGLTATVGALGLAAVADPSVNALGSPAPAGIRPSRLALRLAAGSQGVAGKRAVHRRLRGDAAYADGELTHLDGRPAGAFASSSGVVGHSGRHAPSAIQSVCLHVFKLADGQLIGAGAGHSDSLVGEFALLGGTGRYSGVRGSYRISLEQSGHLVTIDLRT